MINWFTESSSQSYSQPTVKSGYKPDTNGVQKSCQATPQVAQGTQAPDHPQTISRPPTGTLRQPSGDPQRMAHSITGQAEA